MFIFKKFKFLPPKFQRWSSTLKDQLGDDSIVDRLTQTSEDVASFVRFNRPIKAINVEQYQELYSRNASDKSDHELKAIELKIKLICCEYEYLCCLNARVPMVVSKQDMKIMLNMKSSEQRQIFLIHSYFNETRKARTQVKKLLNRKLKEKLRPTSIWEHGVFSQHDQIQYGLFKNSLFSRFTNKTPRLIVQSGINACLWGPKLVFDWHLPPTLLEESGPKLLSEKSADKLARQIFKITNQNLKVYPPYKPTFQVIHLNTGQENNQCFKLFQSRHIQSSFLDSLFFDHHPESPVEHFPKKIMFYINPYAERIFDEDDLRMWQQHQQKELIFVFSPFTELRGVGRKFIENMFESKECNQSSSDHISIMFRRLPIHCYVESSQKYLVLSYFIDCLRDVLMDSKDWKEAFYKNVPKRHFNHQNM